MRLEPVPNDNGNGVQQLVCTRNEDFLLTANVIAEVEPPELSQDILPKIRTAMRKGQIPFSFSADETTRVVSDLHEVVKKTSASPEDEASYLGQASRMALAECADPSLDTSFNEQVAEAQAEEGKTATAKTIGEQAEAVGAEFELVGKLAMKARDRYEQSEAVEVDPELLRADVTLLMTKGPV